MSKKLLLADDSVTIQRVIELTFSGEDVQVLAVGDGEEAIARIPFERPDIVLADIGMPKRSGYEVSAFVKGHPELSHIPVLLLAGAFEPVDDAKALESKCDGVLVKPFEPQHVVARVRELVRGAKGSPTQPAVQDIGRPAARLAPFRPVELPTREDRAAIPQDLVDVVEADLGPRISELLPEPEIEMNGSLDDYFDKLDEAFSSMGGSSLSASAPVVAAPEFIQFAAVPDRGGLEGFDEPGLIEASATQLVEAAATGSFGRVEIAREASPLPTLEDLLSSPTMQSTSMSVEPLPVDSTLAADLTLEVPSERASTLDVLATSLSEGGSGRSIIADAFSALLAVEQGEPGATLVRLGRHGQAPVVTEAIVDDIAKRVTERLAHGSSDQMSTIVRQVVSEVAERLVREEIARIRQA